jgi:pSer/pThr/pTyr-binding forkhead associated (FHA) protein
VASELVVHTPEGRPRVVRLDAHDVTFGRAPASTVVLDDAYVSDHHAKVFLSGDEWCVTDLGSTNGTFLNQLKVTSPTPIAAGDQLAIGKTVVQVRK